VDGRPWQFVRVNEVMGRKVQVCWSVKGRCMSSFGCVLDEGPEDGFAISYRWRHQ
jgi:hypothetical protein